MKTLSRSRRSEALHDIHEFQQWVHVWPFRVRVVSRSSQRSSQRRSDSARTISASRTIASTSSLSPSGLRRVARVYHLLAKQGDFIDNAELIDDYRTARHAELKLLAHREGLEPPTPRFEVLISCCKINNLLTLCR